MLLSISQRIVWGSVFAVSVSLTLGGSGFLAESAADGTSPDPKADDKPTGRTRPGTTLRVEPVGRQATREFWADQSATLRSAELDGRSVATDDLDLTPSADEMRARLARLEQMNAVAARIGQETPPSPPPQSQPQPVDEKPAPGPTPQEPSDESKPPAQTPPQTQEAPAGGATQPTTSESRPTTQRIGRRTPEEVERDREASRKRMEEARKRFADERAKREAERQKAASQATDAPQQLSLIHI